MAKHKRITQAEFKKIKSLQDVGFSIGKTASILDRSYHTIKKVFESAAHEDYKRPSKKTVTTAQTADDLAKIVVNINEQLNKITEQITFLSEHTPVHKTKKFGW